MVGKWHWLLWPRFCSTHQFFLHGGHFGIRFIITLILKPLSQSCTVDEAETYTAPLAPWCSYASTKTKLHGNICCVASCLYRKVRDSFSHKAWLWKQRISASKSMLWSAVVLTDPGKSSRSSHLLYLGSKAFHWHLQTFKSPTLSHSRTSVGPTKSELTSGHVFVTGVSLQCGGVHVQGVHLQRCLCYRGSQLLQVSMLQRFSYYKRIHTGVHVREVFML